MKKKDAPVAAVKSGTGCVWCERENILFKNLMGV
jgi:hypothetical protein